MAKGTVLASGSGERMADKGGGGWVLGSSQLISGASANQGGGVVRERLGRALSLVFPK